MAKTTTIKATSRVAMKIKDNFYTVEYTEERSLEDRDNVEDERKALWDTVNNEVDNQIEEIYDTFR